jgi:hypothetical protein
MPTSEEIQKAVAQSLIKTLKLTELGDKFKGPELLFLISKKWPQVFASGILNLEQLNHDMATTPDVDKVALLGFFLYFRDQEQALGIQMQLPSELILMPQLKRDKLYQQTKKAVDARLAAQMTAPVVRDTPQERAQKIVLGSRKRKLRTVLATTAVVLMLFSIGFNIYSHTPPRPDIKPVSDLNVTALGLPGTLMAKESIYVLKVPASEWANIPRELQRTRLQALIRVLEQRGLKILIVTDENVVTQAVGSPQSLSFVEQRPK